MTPTPSLDLRLDVHVGDGDDRAALGADVRAGLTSQPKWMPPKWLYDRAGCALFDRITEVAEYYPTRCERSILARSGGAIARRSGADTLVELGSGNSDKTRLLLDALAGTGRLRRFIPFEISLGSLTAGASAAARAYPEVEVHGVAGDFERHLAKLPAGGRRLVAFLGGTVGNLLPEARAAFLASLADTLSPGDTVLLGTDLVKDPDRLVAAYDDKDGVTGEFNRNLLRRLNRELGADFDPNRFIHVAYWDPAAEWIEMRLRSCGAQTVCIADLDMAVDFADGEDLRTEISAKFRRDGVIAELAAAGLDTVGWWTDDDGDYAVSLSTPMRDGPDSPTGGHDDANG